MKNDHPEWNRRTFLAAASVLAAGAPGGFGVQATDSSRPRHNFADPHRIRYDGKSLFLDDKPYFLYSGSFHYFRCPKPLWRARFEKIRQAGFNGVQSYVAWNFHEREKPASPDDMSQIHLLDDLNDWLAMATGEFGLSVTIRPGPYICAEWDTGGFPRWLLPLRPKNFHGIWLRSDDPTFVEWSRHWYRAVCPVIAPHQITRKKPGEAGVILFQIENEYDCIAFPKQVKEHYLELLVAAAREGGINVPLFTNWGKVVLGSHNPELRQVFDAMDIYPGWRVESSIGNYRNMRRAQPEAPLMTSELQGGWIVGVDEVPPLRTNEDHYVSDLGPSQINNLTLFAIQEGITLINYYMLFGGTNFGAWAARGVATTYDYSAPIRENGGVGSKYRQVAGIAAMLRDHGTSLARSEKIAMHATTGFPDVQVVGRRSPGGGIYLFIRTNQHTRPRNGVAKISGDGLPPIRLRYELEPFGSKILFLPAGVHDPARGRWFPEIPSQPKRPKVLPGPIAITKVRSTIDPLPTEFRPVTSGESLADLGVYESGFSYYRVHAHRKPDHDGEPHLILRMPAGDGVTAMIGTHLLYAEKGSIGEFVWPTGQASEAMDTTLVYENAGHPNFGETLENSYGISSVELQHFSMEPPIRLWRMKTLPPPIRPSDAPIGPEISDTAWPTVDCASIDTKSMKPNTWAVFRVKIGVTAAQITEKRTWLRFEQIHGEGWVFVNGQLIGHCASGVQAGFYNASDSLKPGRNLVAVLVHDHTGMGGIGRVAFTTSPAREKGTLEFHTGPTGLKRGFFHTDFDDRNWVSHSPGVGMPPQALLVWQRMEFTLPRTPQSIWLPWCLKLQAFGNGFIYFNGRALGRFWQHGGQREYFLPDNWIKPERNVIALCLRPVDRPCGITAAAIVPYTWYAEFRNTPD
jgi:hypothetical protein